MTAVPRQRSPLAHGPDGRCGSCRTCTSCDGGRAATPAAYRILHGAAGLRLMVCAACDDRTVTCLNVDPTMTAPPERIDQ